MSATFKTPCGRIVSGSLYKAQTTDADGRPLTVKSGPDMGKPTKRWFFAVAIPKGNETHWAHTEWGRVIWNEGCTAFPNDSQTPAFAWKVADGDCTSKVNSQNKAKKQRNCDKEGWPGNWILSFTCGFAPRVLKLDHKTGAVNEYPGEGLVNPGDFVQVFGNVSGNKSTSTPGVFLNFEYVCFIAYGEPIHFGTDPDTIGFGVTQLPVGASLTPVATVDGGIASPTAAPTTPPPAMPVTTHTPPPPPVAGVAAPVHSSVPPAPINPHPAILSPNNPAAAVVPPPQAKPVIKFHPQYNKDNNITYDQMIASGVWTHELLVQYGLID